MLGENAPSPPPVVQNVKRMHAPVAVKNLTGKRTKQGGKTIGSLFQIGLFHVNKHKNK